MTSSGAAPVRLRTMSQAEYDAWYPQSVNEYAEHHAKAGSMPADKAHEMAATQFAELLPQGVTTPGQHLLVGEVEGAQVGILWLNVPTAAQPGKPLNAFIYDVEVDAAHRGKGYGRALMVQAETYAAAEGAASIKLHVFGDNTVARSLYQSLGYAETNVSMAKTLPQQ